MNNIIKNVFKFLITYVIIVSSIFYLFCYIIECVGFAVCDDIKINFFMLLFLFSGISIVQFILYIRNKIIKYVTIVILIFIYVFLLLNIIMYAIFGKEYFEYDKEVNGRKYIMRDYNMGLVDSETKHLCYYDYLNPIFYMPEERIIIVSWKRQKYIEYYDKNADLFKHIDGTNEIDYDILEQIY